MKIKLAMLVLKFRFGRVGFHIVACTKSHKYLWHYRGIQRELSFLPLI